MLSPDLSIIKTVRLHSQPFTGKQGVWTELLVKFLKVLDDSLLEHTIAC